MQGLPETTSTCPINVDTVVARRLLDGLVVPSVTHTDVRPPLPIRLVRSLVTVPRVVTPNNSFQKWTNV